MEHGSTSDGRGCWAGIEAGWKSASSSSSSKSRSCWMLGSLLLKGSFPLPPILQLTYQCQPSAFLWFESLHSAQIRLFNPSHLNFSSENGTGWNVPFHSSINKRILQVTLTMKKLLQNLNDRYTKSGTHTDERMSAWAAAKFLGGAWQWHTSDALGTFAFDKVLMQAIEEAEYLYVICQYINHSCMNTFAAVTSLFWILGGPLRADWGLAAKGGNPPSVSKRAVHALFALPSPPEKSYQNW